MVIQSVNPANGNVIQTYEEMPPQEINAIIHKAHDAFLSWKKTSFALRADLMAGAADLLRKYKDEYGKLMALEMGKPIRD
ncbi:MAG TPA: aldehyde dehydrogenase family protein, partial [bacterium]|nr:aldehyde dehydrogenase family protein [bacterium]